MLPFQNRSLTPALVTLALTTWACTSDSTGPELPVGAHPQAAGELPGTNGTPSGPVNGFLLCTPLSNQTRQQTIGPAGGAIRTSHYQLMVPAGALSQSVTIRMEQVSGTVNSVKFAPEQLQFTVPARLTMSYRNCQPNGAGTPNLIAYVDNALQVLEVRVTRDDQAEQRVAAPIDHFSRYAVAW